MPKQYRVTFSNGREEYSYIHEPDEEEIELYHFREGQWVKPFPNIEGDSLAYGLVEAEYQSDYCAPVFFERGITRVTISELRG